MHLVIDLLSHLLKQQNNDRTGYFESLAFPEVRQNLLVGPAIVSECRPLVVVQSVSPGVNHVIEGARAAQRFATRPGTPIILHAEASVFLRLDSIPPIVIARLIRTHEHRYLVNEILGCTGLEQEDFPIWILRETVRNRRTSRARAHYHEIVLSMTRQRYRPDIVAAETVALQEFEENFAASRQRCHRQQQRCYPSGLHDDRLLGLKNIRSCITFVDNFFFQ